VRLDCESGDCGVISHSGIQINLTNGNFCKGPNLGLNLLVARPGMKRGPSKEKATAKTR
jgi:hypothetical protein